MKWVIRASSMLLCGAALLMSASAALPQDPSPTLSQLEEQIRQLRQEIDAATTRKAQLARNQSQREAYLREVGIQIAKGEQLLTAYSRDIRQKTAQAEQLRGRIETLGLEIDRLEAAVSAYAVQLYKRGRRRAVEIVLGGESFADSIRRLRAVTIVAAREQESVDRLALSRSEQTENRTRITRTIDGLQRSRREQRSEQERLNRAKADAGAELALIAQDQEQLQQRLQEASAALNMLINQKMELLRQRTARGIPSDVELGGFEQVRGILPWPIDSPYGTGEVVRGFGRHQGRDNTVTTSPGIDILAPDVDTDVLAVHNGEVMHVGWHPHLGIVVVLWHGDDYATAYSNVDGLTVIEGDGVGVGFRLGGVGEALRPVGQDVDGRLLRFSIHKGLTSIDPMPWFGGRR